MKNPMIVISTVGKIEMAIIAWWFYFVSRRAFSRRHSAFLGTHQVGRYRIDRLCEEESFRVITFQLEDLRG